ncbi:MAG: HAMP domain-containing protein [Chloroflexota bacterium]|nr:MAG: HAMP domain-containing protein [Chloroflexota bacterium]
MWRLFADLSLEKRVPLFAGAALVIILGTFGLLDLQAVNDSRNHALQERLVTARAIAGHIDLALGQTLRTLEMTAELLAPRLEEDDLEQAKTILSHAFEQLGIFKHYIFLLDVDGNLLWLISRSDVQEACVGDDIVDRPFIGKVLRSSGPIISEVQCYMSDGTSVVCLAAPIKNASGETIGFVGGAIDVADPTIGGFVNTLQLGETGYAQILDANGVVLASISNGSSEQKNEHSARFAQLIKEKRAVVSECHNCHESGSSSEKREDILAFASVSITDWGVAIRQAEGEVFAEAHDLERKLATLTFLAVLAVVFFAWILMRGITIPLGSMTLAAERIAAGNLSQGVSLPRNDEIGRLARAFETMRLRLGDSLEKVTNWNKQLEERVQQRTVDLEESRREIMRLYEELQRKEQVRRELLRVIISVQEEERRRIARELHDETSQALTALSMGLETAGHSPGASAAEIIQRVDELRPLVVETLDEVHRLIFDLRPSSLDDLGLVAALQSYAESRLESIGIKVHFDVNVEDVEQRLPSQTESALFRIIQEALTNVVKHAEADNVTVALRFSEAGVWAKIEDDGRGFAVDQNLGTNGKRSGFGLLGMSERVALLQGSVSIDSHAGRGTRVEVHIPLDAQERS